MPSCLPIMIDLYVTGSSLAITEWADCGLTICLASNFSWSTGGVLQQIGMQIGMQKSFLHSLRKRVRPSRMSTVINHDSILFPKSCPLLNRRSWPSSRGRLCLSACESSVLRRDLPLPHDGFLCTLIYSRTGCLQGNYTWDQSWGSLAFRCNASGRQLGTCFRIAPSWSGYHQWNCWELVTPIWLRCFPGIGVETWANLTTQTCQLG